MSYDWDTFMNNGLFGQPLSVIALHENCILSFTDTRYNTGYKIQVDILWWMELLPDEADYNPLERKHTNLI